jgi:hypothetical protein
MGLNAAMNQLFIHFKKAYGPLKMELSNNGIFLVWCLQIVVWLMKCVSAKYIANSVHTNKFLICIFSTKNGLRLADALTPFIFIVTL